jgi:Holliday junction resolvase RusA-like endonuclease
MSKQQIVVFPFLPPSANRCYRSTGNRVYKSKIYTQYEKQMNAFLETKPELEKILGNVKLHITFFKKDKRKYDIDNRLKSFLDSIENRLIENDNCVQQLSVRKYNSCSTDKTLLVITQLTEE